MTLRRFDISTAVDDYGDEIVDHSPCACGVYCFAEEALAEIDRLKKELEAARNTTEFLLRKEYYKTLDMKKAMESALKEIWAVSEKVLRDTLEKRPEAK